MKAILLALLALSIGIGRGGPTPPGRVVILQVAGELDEAHVALMRRAAGLIKADRPDLVLVEIDTPGGRLDHMLSIGEVLQNLAPIPTASYIRPLTHRGVTGGAWSAGAYLALSCSRLYMYPGTVIGAAAPVMMTGEGPAPVAEKYVSAFREKFRARAESNGYPPNLAAAMVDEDLEVFEIVVRGEKRFLTAGDIEKLKAAGETFHKPEVPYVSKGKLLTMTDLQVADAGMGRVVSDRSRIYLDLGLQSPQERVIEASWSESLVGFLTSPLVSMLLLGLGILGIWVEIKTPGFGVPGVAGILAIAVLLFGHHLAGLAEIPEILLFAAGAGLLALEIFAFPGVGVFAILGVLCMLSGLVLSLQDFTLPDPGGAPWQMDILMSSVGRVLFSFVGAGIGLLAVLRFLPRVPYLGRLVHVSGITGTAPEPLSASDLVGRRGYAMTQLRPGGKVDVDGRILDVVADGEFVAPGEPVEILRIEGTRIVAAKAKR